MTEKSMEDNGLDTNVSGKKTNHGWLDGLPEDVKLHLKDEFGVMKRSNGTWICVGKLNLQTEEVRTIEKFMKKICRSGSFWMTTQSLVWCPITSDIINRQERRYPFRTFRFHLHMTFAQGKDIRGIDSWQPIEYSFMHYCGNMSHDYSLTDGCFTHTFARRRGFYILRNGDLINAY